MKPFRFCPSCGKELTHPPDGEGGVRCDGCERSWYRNAAPTAGCVIVRDGRALVTVRGSDPEKGKHDVAGGFLRFDEDPLTGLRREVREELGVEIDVSEKDFVQAVPHRYGDEDDWVLSFGFIARLARGEPQPADDVADIKWVTAEEAEQLDFAWRHDRDLVLAALRASSRT